jgi:glycosyltransferase A (GT-A) superfamily protein (DUF2064 family)
VLAKKPQPGLVKTRLSPPYSAEQAATLAAAALADTLAAVAATPAARRLLVLDGVPGPWLPVGIEVLPQRGQGLAERIAAAFADAYRTRPLPMLLVGMDTPQLTAATLAAAAAHLLAPATDAVLGLAADGGWWAMWLRWPDERLPADVLMSTQATGRVQRDRLVGASLRVHDLPRMHDVDTQWTSSGWPPRHPRPGLPPPRRAWRRCVGVSVGSGIG